MRNNRNWIVRFCVLFAIAIAAGVVIGFMDSKNSKSVPNNNAREKSSIKSEARAERECVKITLSELEELVSNMKKMPSYANLGVPILVDSVVAINFGALDKAYRENLVGSDDNSERWKDYLVTENSDAASHQFHFKTFDVDGVVVVDFPAFILAKFVDVYEAACNIN